jgi:uncharacterized protein (DUF1501 family)
MQETNNAKLSAAQPGAIYAGPEEVPVALWGRRSEAISLTDLGDMKLPFAVDQLSPHAHTADAAAPENEGLELFVSRQLLSSYTAAEAFQQQIRSGPKSEAAKYPATKLAANLELISQLIKSGSQARVFYTQQGGYDTHAAQLYAHAQLLGEFSSALKAFLDDIKAAGLEDRVIALAFSEFGRRVKENSSQGTDHGAAGPVFVAGRKSIGGLVGAAPSLSDLDEGDLKMNVDMREIYTAVLEDWLGVDAASVLGGSFAKAKLFET